MQYRILKIKSLKPLLPKQSLHLKIPIDKLSKNKRKSFELQSDTLILILTADKFRSTITFNRDDYLKKPSISIT